MPPLVPLRELVTVEQTIADKSIYRKNLMPVTYVIGDVAGEIESPVYAILEMNQKLAQLDAREFGGTQRSAHVLNAAQPFTDHEPAMKWDGEWHITIEVFRDLGLAFAAVLMLIYVLMVGWFRSFLTPLVVMAAIPVLAGRHPAGARRDGGVLHRHVDDRFHGGRRHRGSQLDHPGRLHRTAPREGMPLAEAVIDAGAVRFRPMLLTAVAVIVGAGGDPVRPDLPGTGDLADGGRGGLAADQPRGGAGALLHGLSGQGLGGDGPRKPGCSGVS